METKKALIPTLFQYLLVNGVSRFTHLIDQKFKYLNKKILYLISTNLETPIFNLYKGQSNGYFKIIVRFKKDDSAKAEMGVDTFNLIKIFRAMSYRLGETVFDLLDNSIDALADEVRVTINS